MPRIPEVEIERMKRETDLVALVRSRGIELHKHGSKDFAGKCPFHADDKPSLIVSPDKGLFHCMGCGVAGNSIQFVQKFDGVSFRHAFEILNAGKAFSALPGGPKKNATILRLNNPFDETAPDQVLMCQVVDYYHARLLRTPAALEYLKSRGLYDEACPLRREALSVFRLGFADRTLGLRLPDANRKGGEALRGRLQKLGILRESGHEHFSGSVVLPIYSGAGSAADRRVTEIYGRKITPNLRKGTPQHLYLPGRHEGIWNAAALREGVLILCEAPLDGLTFYVNGFKNVTFIYGTEGFTEELFEAILAHKVGRVYLAYDADEAGNRAAARDAGRFLAHGLEVYRVKFPHGMDANEYAQKVQPAVQSLQTALNAAEWIGGTSSRVRADAPSSESLAAEKLAADEKKQPDPTPEAVTLERMGEYYVMQMGQRQYRVGGLEKNNSLDVLKVTVRLLVLRSFGEGGKHSENPSTPLGECLFHLDSFDMARDVDRRRFIERAAEETKLERELVKRDLGKLLLALEQAQTNRINTALKTGQSEPAPDLTDAERREALEFLQSPDLIEKIGVAFDACGLVGEDSNRLAAYLACTSRKLERPLAVIVQSTSAAGKSMLMESVVRMFPEEERIKYSAMTGQSLYYLGATNLRHKILAIVEEEGAEKASYALKLLQSEGELTIASTGKDPTTGRMETQEYHVEGPVMIFLTTTAVEIDEELLNRCLILTVDESRAQTERIHKLQRQARTLDGLKLRNRQPKLLTLLRNAQRLIEPVAIMNPYAGALTFPAELTRTRRDHEKYLTLMDAITLLHQHQRPRETNTEGERFDFVRVTLDDIALANRLAPELLGRSLDELPPQTRRLLMQIKAFVRARMKEQEVEQSCALFSRRELRQLSGWSEFQVRIHLVKLETLEYVSRRWGRQGQSCAYELLTDVNEPDNVWHIGLLDVDKLRRKKPAVMPMMETSCIPEGASCDFVNAASRSATA